MRARVRVDEWRIGDWGRSIEVGQVITLLTYEPEPEHIAGLAESIGAVHAASVTHEIADVETDLTADLRGRVVAIDALWESYPPHGGRSVPGSGVLEPTQRAQLRDDPDSRGRVVTTYLIDLER